MLEFAPAPGSTTEFTEAIKEGGGWVLVGILVFLTLRWVLSRADRMLDQYQASLEGHKESLTTYTETVKDFRRAIAQFERFQDAHVHLTEHLTVQVSEMHDELKRLNRICHPGDSGA